jgi:uncharacterized membrane protein
MIRTSTVAAAEEWVTVAVEWLRLLLETTSALIIALGVVMALRAFLRKGSLAQFHAVRLTLASYLALALEFQLGADILSTAIAPTWDEIGKLGAIAVIRTALNFFLMHEIEHAKKDAGEHPLQE